MKSLRVNFSVGVRSEEHTSELQSRLHLVCRLLLEKKNSFSRSLPLTTQRSCFSTPSLLLLPPRRSPVPPRSHVADTEALADKSFILFLKDRPPPPHPPPPPPPGMTYRR